MLQLHLQTHSFVKPDPLDNAIQHNGRALKHGALKEFVLQVGSGRETQELPLTAESLLVCAKAVKEGTMSFQTLDGVGVEPEGTTLADGRSEGQRIFWELGVALDRQLDRSNPSVEGAVLLRTKPVLQELGRVTQLRLIKPAARKFPCFQIYYVRTEGAPGTGGETASFKYAAEVAKLEELMGRLGGLSPCFRVEIVQPLNNVCVDF